MPRGCVGTEAMAEEGGSRKGPLWLIDTTATARCTVQQAAKCSTHLVLDGAALEVPRLCRWCSSSSILPALYNGCGLGGYAAHSMGARGVLCVFRSAVFALLALSAVVLCCCGVSLEHKLLVVMNVFGRLHGLIHQVRAQNARGAAFRAVDDEARARAPRRCSRCIEPRPRSRLSRSLWKKSVGTVTQGAANQRCWGGRRGFEGGST